MLKKFIIKLIFLSLPFLLISSLVISYLTKTGELYYSYQQLAEYSKSPIPCLIGLAHTDPTAIVKLRILKENKYEVIALGTSRVLAFRSTFFKKSTFYNCGRCISRIMNLRSFLSKIPKDATPKIILLGLDQDFFNGRVDSNYSSDSLYICNLDKTYSFFNTFQEDIIGLRQDMKTRKITLSDLGLIFNNIDFKKMGLRKIGLDAFYNDDGFRNDGSYNYGNITKNPKNPNLEDYKFKHTLAKIESQSGSFKFEHDINPNAISELDNFLIECEKRNIHVVGFIPPYAQEVYDKLTTMKDRYGYLSKIYPALESLFNKHGLVVMDFSDMKSFGAKKEEAIDGMHASEKAYMRILLKLIEKDDILKAFARDVNYLKNRLDISNNDIVVFSQNEN